MHRSPSDPVAGIPLPATDLAAAALRFAEEAEPAFVYRHSVRSYLFARALADRRGLRPGTDFDDELVFLGCVLHDLGLTAQGNGAHQFEVDGADLAARFLRGQGVEERRVEVVWDAVALHTSAGIAARKGPDVALAQSGIAVDMLGHGREELPPGLAERVHAALPRDDLAHAIIDLIAEQAAANPAKVDPLGFTGHVLRPRLPRGALPDWQDLIAASGWGDRPTAPPADVGPADVDPDT
ncbi:HD domain-containing protein [Nocardiopsis chromatogenes]|uniref:HD domain-containing protein n=1 Tax=Nocardiopsis chromatogenes TaxID=280239 RepID=UPI000684CBE1|nr:HD domain-containing protein [Nocardiopsis chromatogenes]